MKNEEKSFAAQLGIIALILTMGVSSMINADNTRMHLDIFLWSNNMTEISPEVIQEIKEKENIIIQELIFGLVFIIGGAIWLSYMGWKYSKKSNDVERA